MSNIGKVDTSAADVNVLLPNLASGGTAGEVARGGNVDSSAVDVKVVRKLTEASRAAKVLVVPRIFLCGTELRGTLRHAYIYIYIYTYV